MTLPVAVVTNVVSPYRREPFRLLAQRQGAEVIAWQQAGGAVPGLTVHRTTQIGAARLVGSGRYRAVVCGLGGRIALPATYVAARRARVPFVLWAGIWAHPRTPAHALAWPATRHLYRHADAVVTYGPHVSRYVERFRERGDVFVAPQAVDVEHFGARVPDEQRAAARERAGAPGDELLVLFAGRLEEEKGVEVLLEAWRRAGLQDTVRLALAGSGPLEAAVLNAGTGVRGLGYVPESELPALYAGADVLVLPSARTATFLEPWGLVVNEAMLQSTPVIVSDAVGALAGGLVRDGRNGLSFPAGDAEALAARLTTLAAAPAMRAEMGRAAARDAAAYTPSAWADGVTNALNAASVGRKG
jgi:glycosyltransferase involved in cell wall biosynthesis